MLLPILTFATILRPSFAESLLSSGMFLIRLSSGQPVRVEYCFTELPNAVHKRPGSRCLKSGAVDVVNKTETVVDLRIANFTKAHVSVEFNIVRKNGGPSESLAERMVVDGALPARRVAVANGLVVEFVTVCDRPFYGLMCSRYCVEREHTHYVCDPRGEKVCLTGWTGKDCDIAAKDVFPSLAGDATSTPSSSSSSIPRSTGKLPSQRLVTSTITPSTTVGDVITTGVATSAPAIRAVHPASPTVGFTFSTRVTVLPTSTSDSIPQSTTASHEEDFLPVRYESLPTTHISARSAVETGLILLLILLSICVFGYQLVKWVRSPPMQNWLNKKRATIFAAATCPTFQRYSIDESMPKIVVLDSKKTHEKIAYQSTDEMGPRYSSQPTSGAAGRPSGSDISLGESNPYHEIDSFFVSSAADLQIATLV